MDWGWNPDTVSAVTTALAALAAVVAGIFAFAAYRAEREARDHAAATVALAADARDAERERDERERTRAIRQQAELVAVWAEANDSDEGDVQVWVQNGSAAPVYAVRAGLQLGSNGHYAFHRRVAPPTGNTPMLCDVKDYTVSSWRDWAGSRRPRPLPLVEVTFRDAAGLWWLRDANGVLSGITEETAWRYESRKSGGDPAATKSGLT